MAGELYDQLLQVMAQIQSVQQRLEEMLERLAQTTDEVVPVARDPATVAVERQFSYGARYASAATRDSEWTARTSPVYTSVRSGTSPGLDSGGNEGWSSRALRPDEPGRSFCLERPLPDPYVLSAPAEARVQAHVSPVTNAYPASVKSSGSMVGRQSEHPDYVRPSF
jgi:hypothetical protein